MRSIRLKLTLAFFLTGLLGMFLTLLVISDRTIGQPATEAFIPREVLQEDLGDAFQLAFVGSVVAALLVGTLLGRALARPIQQLTNATRKLAQGELGHQVAITSKDEVGELADAFNRMSADLAEARQQREQMTADIAHDLRTPLSIIAGYAEALDEGKIASSPQIQRTIRHQVDQLQHLVEDLRTLSLADAGELPLNLRPIEPIALLEQTAIAFMPSAVDKEITLDIDATDSLPHIHIDVERMTQVLHNLVSNALRHSPRGGTITLAASHGNGLSQLQVSNTGSGIAPEDLRHIFDRFYRADQSRSRQQGGSGLGLAIAKAIVVGHNGRLSATSSPQGTTFTIELPQK
ncbi:MAG: ATP-binding protein [Chloroflexota bacterium]